MNRDTMKFSNSDHKMYFYSTTKVTKCTDFVGPKNCLSFADFPSLIDEKIPTNMSIDVIGNVFKVYPMVRKAINKDQSITIKMEDLNGTIIWITLFGAYADQIVDYVAVHPGHFVMVVQCAKYKIYKGMSVKAIVFSIIKHYYIRKLNTHLPTIQELLTHKSKSITITYNYKQNQQTKIVKDKHRNNTNSVAVDSFFWHPFNTARDLQTPELRCSLHLHLRTNMVLTLWSRRSKHTQPSTFDLTKTFEGLNNHFTLKIHHNGAFTASPGRKYVNGTVDYYDFVDSDVFSIVEFLRIGCTIIGRPKKKRKRAADEPRKCTSLSRKYLTVTCSKCNKKGINLSVRGHSTRRGREVQVKHSCLGSSESELLLVCFYANLVLWYVKTVNCMPFF
ncbi:hypothetical protein LXL04_029519 [Taraxacum kok-saghyz]